MSRASLRLTIKAPFAFFLSVLLAVLCSERGHCEFIESTELHHVQLLDMPALALSTVLHSIANAKEEIDLEYNSVFVCNWVGVTLFAAIKHRAQELKRAGKSLRVRLLVDGGHYALFAPHLSEAGYAAIVSAYKEQGIELKIFNPLVSMNPLKLARLNIRDHQKRLLVDGRLPSGVLIVGGRLLGNQYYGVGDTLDRIEKDVWISGPLVGKTQDYFDNLWADELSQGDFANGSLTTTDDRKESVDAKSCLAFESVAQCDLNLIDKRAAKEVLARPVLDSRSVLLGLDHPGFFAKTESFVPAFYERVSQAKKSVISEQQYFLPTGKLSRALESLSAARVSVDILTNSLASGDDPDIDRLTELYAKRFSSMPNLKVSLYAGKAPNGGVGLWFPKARAARWQVHSKAVVLDGMSSWIGSNNWDSRSERFNLETGFWFLDQPELARELEASIRADMLGAKAEASEPAPERAWDAIRRIFYRLGEFLL